MTFPIGTNIQPEDTVWYGNTALANAPFTGYMGYADAANDIIEIYNITNSANIEYPITKPDVGENIYFLNSAVVLVYSSLTHILYLKPPASFLEKEVITPNNPDVATQIEKYCCVDNAPKRDFFGNIIDTTPPDKRCHGFAANDSIWQERDDGRRITAKVDREDCANGALYVSLATGHFQSNRDIYKDNGSITANIFASFANLSGKILYTEAVLDEPIAIDRFFTIAEIEDYVIDTNNVTTLITWGNLDNFGGRTV